MKFKTFKDVMIGVKMTKEFRDKLIKVKEAYEKKLGIELTMTQYVMTILTKEITNAENNKD